MNVVNNETISAVQIREFCDRDFDRMLYTMDSEDQVNLVKVKLLAKFPHVEIPEVKSYLFSAECPMVGTLSLEPRLYTFNAAIRSAGLRVFISSLRFDELVVSREEWVTPRLPFYNFVYGMTKEELCSLVIRRVKEVYAADQTVTLSDAHERDTTFQESLHNGLLQVSFGTGHTGRMSLDTDGVLRMSIGRTVRMEVTDVGGNVEVTPHQQLGADELVLASMAAY